jgi:hypothetical protein
MSAIASHSSQLVMLPTLALGSVVALIMGATCLTIDHNFFYLIRPFPKFLIGNNCFKNLTHMGGSLPCDFFMKVSWVNNCLL